MIAIRLFGPYRNQLPTIYWSKRVYSDRGIVCPYYRGSIQIHWPPLRVARNHWLVWVVNVVRRTSTISRASWKRTLNRTNCRLWTHGPVRMRLLTKPKEAGESDWPQLFRFRISYRPLNFPAMSPKMHIRMSRSSFWTSTISTLCARVCENWKRFAFRPTTIKSGCRLLRVHCGWSISNACWPAPFASLIKLKIWAHRLSFTARTDGIERLNYRLSQCFCSIHTIARFAVLRCSSKRSGSVLVINFSIASVTVTIIIPMPIVRRCFCNSSIAFGKWAINFRTHSNSTNTFWSPFSIICTRVASVHFYSTVNVNGLKKVLIVDHSHRLLTNAQNSFNFVVDLKHKTVSLWSFINASTEQYRNPLYGGRTSAIETVLKPVASMRHIRLWKGLYCRWNPSMRAQDPIYQRTRELLALQEQLQKQVDEFRFEKNQKQSNQTGRLASPLHWPSLEIG